MSKIKEKILEPGKISTGSSFLLKIKADRTTTYSELKLRNYDYIKPFIYNDFKGDE